MNLKLRTTKLLATAVLISMLTGCKKYTCECTAYNQSIPESAGSSRFTVKKKDRTSLCTDKSTQPDNDGNYTTCIIK